MTINITIPDFTAENPVAIGSALVKDAAANAAIATGLYYVLKYVYSGGKTSTVCFEDV